MEIVSYILLDIVGVSTSFFGRKNILNIDRSEMKRTKSSGVSLKNDRIYVLSAHERFKKQSVYCIQSNKDSDLEKYLALNTRSTIQHRSGTYVRKSVEVLTKRGTGTQYNVMFLWMQHRLSHRVWAT